jgi:hypothetical protein
LSNWGSGRVVGVEPEHVNCVVVPQRQNQDHTTTKSTTHSLKSAESNEIGVVTKESLLVSAELVTNGSVWENLAREVGSTVGDHDSVLDIESADFNKVTTAGSGIGNKLCYNCEGFGSVDRFTRAVESSVTKTISVEVTSIVIANTVVTGTSSTARGTIASVETVDRAGVGSVGS